ncbi:unnamed protein product, partial [marine sediment metagenome]
CELKIPKTFTGEAPSTSTDFWQYSEIVCTSTETELIQNATTGAEFYLKKSISYGDFLIITFLVVFLIFGIAKFLINFIIPKIIYWKK